MLILQGNHLEWFAKLSALQFEGPKAVHQAFLSKKIYSNKEKSTRIPKFKSTSLFFQHAFDINSGIHSTNERVREFDDLKLNPSDQERNNEEQVINHNTDNTNSQIINNNFEHINNSVMKDTGNMNEIINKNVDMESNKQKMFKKKLFVSSLKTAKILLLKRFQKMVKPILNVILKTI